MKNLVSNYMGLKLKNPLVASSSPITVSLDNFKKLEDTGIGAIVMFSLFEEQIIRESEAYDYYLSKGPENYGEALNYFPTLKDFKIDVDKYFNLLEKASGSVDVPIIASLNGISPEGWTDYAKLLEEAGASALELNIYYVPTDIEIDGREIENNYLKVLLAVKKVVSLPVAVKLNPYFSSVGHMAKQLANAGADALVLFNRFFEPDFDIDKLQILNSLELSSPKDIRLPLLWIGVLFNKINLSLAATTGVSSAVEVVKYLLAGADVVMTTSSLIRNGIEHIAALKSGLENWMDEHEFESVAEIRGLLSRARIAHPTAYERANYIKILEGYKS
jgi:dihydroorotate dehydrogenase (fumarate)